MRSKRIIWFLIMIFIGLAGGLAYGWFINPVKYVDTLPETLRADYKADYVLMVAEIYQMDRNVGGAELRLSFLGKLPPESYVVEGIRTASEIGYSDQDIDLLRDLAQAVAGAAEIQFTPTPGEQP